MGRKNRRRRGRDQGHAQRGRERDDALVFYTRCDGCSALWVVDDEPSSVHVYVLGGDAECAGCRRFLEAEDRHAAEQGWTLSATTDQKRAQALWN